MWNVLGRGCASLEAVLAAVPKRIRPPAPTPHPPNPAIALALKQVQFDDEAREGVEKGPSKKLGIEERRMVMMMSGGMDFGGGTARANPQVLNRH